MTDIEERLRAWEPLISGGHEVPAAGMAMHEAAAEIERLRTLNAEMREALANMLRIMSSGLYRDSAGVKPSAHPDFDEAHAVLAREEREELS